MYKLIIILLFSVIHLYSCTNECTCNANEQKASELENYLPNSNPIFQKQIESITVSIDNRDDASSPVLYAIDSHQKVLWAYELPGNPKVSPMYLLSSPELSKDGQCWVIQFYNETHQEPGRIRLDAKGKFVCYELSAF